jgi:hypothetical protein
MTKAELEQTIKDIEGGIASPSVPEKFKANMRSQLTMLKGKLAEMSKPSTPAKPKATKTPTEKPSLMNDLRGTKKPDAERETAMSLMDIYADGMEEFGIEDQQELLSDQVKQEKLIKYLNRKIEPKFIPNFSSDIRDILEDENYHGLNEYLGLSGKYGLETQKYYLTFKKKHGGADWKKKQLNPKYFGLETDDEETKKAPAPTNSEPYSPVPKQVQQLQKRVYAFLKKKYPQYEGKSELEDQDEFWDMVEDVRKNYDTEPNPQYGEIGEELVRFYLWGDEKEDKEAPKKKGVPLPKEKQSSDNDYDCDELIEKEKQRRAKAKERASKPKKSEATKNKEKLEKVFDNVKERAIEEDITKSELEKLISSTEDLLKLLKDKLAKLK